MSDDQLDKDLINRIKQVFDDYQDDTAEKGWLLLRKKYPEEKKNRVVLWWRLAGVAAFLLLVLNIFLWYNDDKNYKKKITNIHKIERTNSAVMTVAGTKIIQQDSSTVGANMYKQGASKLIVITKQPLTIRKPTIANQSLNIFSHRQPGFLRDSGYNYKSKTILIVANSTNTSLVKDSIKTVIQPPYTSLIDKKGNMIVQQQTIVVSKAMQQLFDKEDKAKKNTEERQASNKIAFGVYAASYINYAKGSQRQFNNGAGISSDIKLTHNLSISTGLSIGQNTLAYNSTAPTVLPSALVASNSRNFMASASMLPLVVPSSKNLNASLVNLDIPVNLKYNFNPQTQTNSTYFEAGLSSGTFINESYNTIYSYNTFNNSSIQQSQENHKAFDNFYFAQMLNLAFGLGYPLGKNQLVIEPFFKYPLNGLGDQHILFGSGGINLKFNFDSEKTRK